MKDKSTNNKIFFFWDKLPSELQLVVLKNLDGATYFQTRFVCKKMYEWWLTKSKKTLEAIHFIKSDPFFIAKEDVAAITLKEYLGSKQRFIRIAPYGKYINLFKCYKIDYTIIFGGAKAYHEKCEFILVTNLGEILVLNDNFKHKDAQINDYLFSAEKRLVIKTLKELDCIESKEGDYLLYKKILSSGESCSFLLELGLDRERDFIWPQYANCDMDTLHEYIKEGQQGYHDKEFIDICLELERIIINNNTSLSMK